MPVDKSVGNKVICGTLNGGGAVLLCVERIGEETVPPFTCFTSTKVQNTDS
jgi:cation transport ATPase